MYPVQVKNKIKQENTAIHSGQRLLLPLIKFDCNEIWQDSISDHWFPAFLSASQSYLAGLTEISSQSFITRLRY